MKRVILIADDSSTVRDMLASFFGEKGYEVVTAEDGLDAVIKTYACLPDLILLDIFMPKINGYQVCRLLKKDDNTSGIPIIILTSQGTVESQFWSLKTGADRFFIKDFNSIDIMAGIVNDIIEKNSAHPQPVKSCKTHSDPIEIMSKISSLLDKDLYQSTIDKIKSEIIVNSLVEGLFTIDKDYKITAWNKALESITGLSEIETGGKDVKEVFGNTLLKQSNYFDETFRKKTDLVDIEAVLKNKDGKDVPVFFSISLLKGDRDNIEGAVCIIKDITKLKELEKMKSDFVSMMTHELRNPLGIIKGTVEMFLDNIVGDINEKQRKHLTTVQKTSVRLINLVNDLLDISKMEQGNVVLNIEKADIREVAKSCVEGIKILADQKNVALNEKTQKNIPLIRFDTNKIEQVYINILSNALKYTPEGGEITVELFDKENFVETHISDTGSGIPKDSLNKIFDKFQQIYDSSSRKKGGTGLGLAVVKSIVESHGGKVWAESEPGKGSKFIFTIPKSRD